MAGADADRRVAHVIGRDESVARVVGFIGRVALQLLALREHRRFARAKLFALHLVRLEIVADVFADPDLIALLDAHVAVGHHLARLRVHRRAVRHQRRVAVFHENAVRADDRVSLHVQLPDWRAGNDFIERPHFPRRLAPVRRGNERKKRAKKKASRTMADNFLIRRGQLNRMNLACQRVSTTRDDKRSPADQPHRVSLIRANDALGRFIPSAER